jgi:hypothetical protein
LTEKKGHASDVTSEQHQRQYLSVYASLMPNTMATTSSNAATEQLTGNLPKCYSASWQCLLRQVQFLFNACYV